MKALKLFLIGLIASWPIAGVAEDDFIVVQSTTSTDNSGLFDHLLPIFVADAGFEVRVVAVGTGQAIRNAASGNGDVLLVHAKSAEEAFVADGFGVERFDLMYNDFVIVGPQSDPAGIADLTRSVDVLARIAESGARFASRGDDSGTHKAELRLWGQTQTNPMEFSGRWYLETGQGMGATLNIARELRAYVLTDRATWLSFGRKTGMAILHEGDPMLFNQYGVTVVSEFANPQVKSDLAAEFVLWLLSDAGQHAIAGFQMNGSQLFFPNAK